jgi:hypothetical protein
MVIKDKCTFCVALSLEMREKTILPNGGMESDFHKNVEKK